jgi:hypothetical protein
VPLTRAFAGFVVAVGLYAAAAPLSILKPSISDIEDGAGVPPTFTFVPGQFIFLTFEIGGYKASDEQKIHLTYKIDALDPKGVRLLETFTNTEDTTLAPEDKNWKPKLRHQILLPPIAPSGTYKIAIQVTDDLGKASVSGEIPFEVRGRDVPPSDTLVVRNFNFFRSEEDREPLKVVAYKPGDTLWARFDIVGYKFGPGNSVDVDYLVSVLAPSGKVLFQQDKPAEGAEEKSSSFYPKAYVPGSMNLNLQSSIRPGQYTVALRARDHIGTQTADVKGTFTVE